MSKRKKLAELFEQLSTPQQELFKKMYKNVDTIPEEKIDWAIIQCKRTLCKNNGIELEKVLVQIKDEIKGNC